MRTSLTTSAIAKGLFGGAAVGFLIGLYIFAFPGRYVLYHQDFSSPIAREWAESRFFAIVLLTCIGVCAAMGPFVAVASSRRWIGHAVYGIVIAISIVVAATLTAAKVSNQQPFNMMKGASSDWIDLTSLYGIPVAILAGSILGVVLGPLVANVRDSARKFITRCVMRH